MSTQRNGNHTEAPPDPGSALINPVTVAEMVSAYNRAIKLVENGHRILSDGNRDLRDAAKLLVNTFGSGPSFATGAVSEADTEAIKRQLQRSVWRAIFDKLDIWKIVSLKRSEELRDRLEKGELPPITDEEVLVMVEATLQNAQEFAKEFALEVYEWLMPGNKQFSNWEAQYVTNKRNGRDELGKKVILTWMIREGYGSHPFQVNYDRHEKLSAMDRLFAILDGAKPPEISSYQTPSAIAINEAGWNGLCETEYFAYRACHNGNLHVVFKRMDLVQKLNVLAGNPTALRQKKHKIKKGDRTKVHVVEAPEVKKERYEEAFYWTPAPVIQRMLDLVPLPSPLFLAGAKVLEPSAGEGHISDCLVAAGVSKKQLFCIEKNYDRVAALLRKGYEVRDIDFLKFAETGWDYIYMNPPFNQEQDMMHVMHAYKLLAPNGKIAAIMSEHDFTAPTPAAIYFRKWLVSVNGTNESLPKYSFREAGTAWDTRLVVIQKSEAQP
jgi:hypothetical protein